VKNFVLSGQTKYDDDIGFNPKESESFPITSIKWSPAGSRLIAGNSVGEVFLFELGDKLNLIKKGKKKMEDLWMKRFVNKFLPLLLRKPKM
jgi:WD40 repeat protein